MTHYTDDPLLDFDRHQADEEEWLSRRPICKDCGEHIQDETAYHNDGVWICHECFENNQRWVLPE
jgi:formylmethanofuran dehydrogenase subunit E